MLGGLLLVTLGVELWLRRAYGLGQPPLYMADARMGYRLAPNQSLRRFGQRIEINQYSMRSGVIHPARSQTCLRILLLGDSVANGGWWTDQPQILSQQLEDALQAAPPEPFQQVQVLNASANSWGPRNQLGYVVRFGLFEAQLVVVLMNTDDLFAIAPTSLPVGRDRAYPRRRPLALWELVSRLLPLRPLPAYEALLAAPGDRLGGNLEALRQLHHQVQDRGSQLLVAMTPLKREIVSQPRDYEIKARHRLSTFLSALGVPYLDLLPPLARYPQPSLLYRDHIHPSPEGYRLISQILQGQILKQLTSPPLPLSPTDLQDPWL